MNRTNVKPVQHRNGILDELDEKNATYVRKAAQLLHLNDSYNTIKMVKHHMFDRAFDRVRAIRRVGNSNNIEP
jgi:hypothetical protein